MQPLAAAIRHTAWLPLTSTTVEPARLDMARWASGGDHLVVSRDQVQLGFVFQAAGDGAAERLYTPRNLGIGHEPSRVCAHVRRE